MRNRKPVIAIISLLIIVSFGAMAFAMTPTAPELLTLSLQRLEAAQSGHAIIAATVESTERSGNGTVEVWGQLDVGPNGEPAVRAEIISATFGDRTLAGTTAVTNGTDFWVYLPDKNRVIVGTLDELRQEMEQRHADAPERFTPGEGDFDPADFPQTPEEAVAKLLEYATAERAGRTTIGNNSAQTVRLAPIPEQMPAEVRAAGGFVNVWIRANDNVPLGAEYVEGSAGTARVEVTTVELDIDIDPATFNFDIPAGAEVVHFSEIEYPAHDSAADIDFALLSPTTLPDNARLVDAGTIRGAHVQRYQLDNGRSFMVAQGRTETAVPDDATSEAVTVRGVSGTLYSNDDGNRTLLTWQKDGIGYWIGGDLSAAEAMAIAESLE